MNDKKIESEMQGCICVKPLSTGSEMNKMV